MAGAKEIRNKIGSVKSTQKITKAMEMVAASKMRRSQDALKGGAHPKVTIQRMVVVSRQSATRDQTSPRERNSRATASSGLGAGSIQRLRIVGDPDI